PGARSVDSLVVHHDVPRRAQPLRVPYGHVILDRVVVDLMDALHGAGLIAVIRLRALILTMRHPNGVSDQGLAVPEADRVSVPQGLGLGVVDVTAAVGVDPTRFALLLVEPPGLVRGH